MKNNLKRQILLIILFFIIYSIFKISSANMINIISSAKNDIAKSGDIVEITIKKGDMPNVSQIDGHISYDSNLLEIVTYDDGKNYKNLSNKVEYFKLASDNNFVIINIDEVESDIVTIGFKVKDGVSFENTEIKFDKLNAYDTNLNLLVENGEQTISLKNKGNNVIARNMIILIIVVVLIIIVVIKKIGNNKRRYTKNKSNRH